MTASHPSSRHFGMVLFTAFKYTIYVLLSINVFLWLREDLAASSELFKEGMALDQIIEGYAATIDTLAWVVLLLMFELETFILPDEKIKGILKWSLHGLRTICYMFIVYAFYGYMAKLMLAYSFSPISVKDACTLVASGFSYVETLDEYVALTMENCAAFNGAPLYQLGELTIISNDAGLTLFRNLAWTDVINAGAWILVVVVLEIDVRLQLGRELSTRANWLGGIAKFILYGTLFGAAVYWWIDGVFLDFWDAFLWLLAFVFIELNVFRWHEEVTESNA